MLRFLTMIACFLGSVFAYAIQADFTACPLQECVAVVDVGSTGSRLHVYAYDRNENHYPVHLTQIAYQTVQPGFATIAHTQKDVNAYLDQLFDHIEFSHIPVYFYATAGMRLLPDDEQVLQYQLLKQWFATHDQWFLKDAKTISGRDEGLYGWLAVNYQLQTFESLQYVGLMDMGGASVQIAFPLKHTQNVPDQDLVQINVNGQRISLFVKSFLGLGQTEMIKRLGDKNVCFTNEYPMSDGLMGQGDAWACVDEASQIMNAKHHVKQSVMPVLSQNPVSQWYTIGGLGMFAAMSVFDFNVLHFTGQSFIDHANDIFCHVSWTQLQEQMPLDDKAYAYCLVSSYYYALLVKGYGLQSSDDIAFFPKMQSVDWSLGVLLTK